MENAKLRRKNENVSTYNQKVQSVDKNIHKRFRQVWYQNYKIYTMTNVNLYGLNQGETADLTTEIDVKQWIPMGNGVHNAGTLCKNTS